jgi:glycosyltransferase involved in cell wall biosynthesis
VRIAYVAPSLGPAEGQGRVNIEILRRLAGRGITVDLYTSRLGVSLPRIIRVHRVPRPFRLELANQILFAVWTTITVTFSHRDLVHVDGGCSLVRADVAAAHMVHGAWRPEAGESGARGVYLRMTGWINVRLERLAYRRAKLVAANSERTRDDLVETGVAADKIRVLPLGVDAKRFRPPTFAERDAARARIGASTEEFIAVLVGPASARKGVPQALDAIASLPGARLVVVGDTRDGRLVRDAKARKINVTFIEWPADPRPYYWAADALVAPAAYEPFGLWVLEGMACGLPAAVGSTAGVAAICDGSAIHIQPTSIEVRDALQTLQGDPERRARMGTLARKLAVQRTWSRTADTLFETYREVVR